MSTSPHLSSLLTYIAGMVAMSSHLWLVDSVVTTSQIQWFHTVTDYGSSLSLMCLVQAVASGYGMRTLVKVCSLWQSNLMSQYLVTCMYLCSNRVWCRFNWTIWSYLLSELSITIWQTGWMLLVYHCVTGQRHCPSVCWSADWRALSVCLRLRWCMSPVLSHVRDVCHTVCYRLLIRF